MNKKIVIIHGPNLNLLEHREKNIYTKLSLGDINSMCLQKAKELNMDLKILQSNIEGIIIDYIQDAYLNKYTHIIINAGAYSHTSIGIHDALKIFGDNVFEVHLSNIHSREDFRSISYISKVSKGVICGFQEHGYLMALDYIHKS